jgi:hypothetical protein
MKYAEHFRKVARRCRVLSKTAVDPELVDQMRLSKRDAAADFSMSKRGAFSARGVDAAACRHPGDPAGIDGLSPVRRSPAIPRSRSRI